jgi:hypothetical protein
VELLHQLDQQVCKHQFTAVLVSALRMWLYESAASVMPYDSKHNFLSGK